MRAGARPDIQTQRAVLVTAGVPEAFADAFSATVVTGFVEIMDNHSDRAGDIAKFIGDVCRDGGEELVLSDAEAVVQAMRARAKAV